MVAFPTFFEVGADEVVVEAAGATMTETEDATETTSELAIDSGRKGAGNAIATATANAKGTGTGGTRIDQDALHPSEEDVRRPETFVIETATVLRGQMAIDLGATPEMGQP